MEAGSGGVILPFKPSDTVADVPQRAAFPIPQSSDDLRDHYDLIFSHPRPDAPEYAAFDRWLADAALRSDLSFALVHDGIVHEVVRRLGTGELTVGLHLGYEALWCWPDDPHVRLALAVEDAGGHALNPPVRVRTFTDRAVTHRELLRLDLGVAPAVLFRPWTGTRALSIKERTRLRLDVHDAGVHIRPATRAGVVTVGHADDEAFLTALSEARSHDPRETFLIQRAFQSPILESDHGPRAAHWRVLYCLDEITIFWWTPLTESGDGYQEVSADEVERLGLRPIYQYAQALADLSGLDWFMSELALSPFTELSRFAIMGEGGDEWPLVAVDYLNDQCDLDVRSRTPGAPPDDFVQGLAWRLAELAWALRQHSYSAPLRLAG
jgi:hypothetical protein